MMQISNSQRFLFLLFGVVGSKVTVGGVTISSLDNFTTVTINSTSGDLASISSPQTLVSLAPSSGSFLSLNEDCSIHVNTIVTDGEDIIVSRGLYCESNNVNVTLIDTYSPSSSSISCTSSYLVNTNTTPFTLPFGTSLLSPTIVTNSSTLSMWTTWTRGCVNNGPGMCFSSGPWLNPFLPASLPVSNNQLYKLGDPLYDSEILGPFGKKIDDTITIPLVTLMSLDDNFGATILLAPTDSLLQVLLQVNSSDIRFVRMLRRFSTNIPINVTMHIRAHAADFRPALELLLDAYPSYVLPHAVNTRCVNFNYLSSSPLVFLSSLFSSIRLSLLL